MSEPLAPAASMPAHSCGGLPLALVVAAALAAGAGLYLLLDCYHQAERREAIPQAFTLTTAYGHDLERRGEGSTTRLVSPYPFSGRVKLPLDGFETAAPAWFADQPGDAVDYRFVDLNRHAAPPSTGPSCVACHNQHPDSPQTSGRLGDPSGIHEVPLPAGPEGAGQALPGKVSERLRDVALYLTGVLLLALIAVAWQGHRTRRALTELAGLADRERRERGQPRMAEGMARLAAILDTANDAIITIDERGTVESANPAVEAVFGYRPEELIGGNVARLMPPEEAARHDSYLRRYRATAERHVIGIGREVTAVRKDGTRFPADLSVSEVLLDERRLFTGVVRDITARKNAEQALRASEAEARKLSAVAARTDNGVVITDPEGRTEWVNDAFTRMTGYALADLLGKKPGAILQGPESNLATVRQMHERLRQGQGFKEEILNYNKAGQPYWVCIEAQPVHDEVGRVTQYVAIERDITQQRAYEQQLEEARDRAESAYRAKSNFLAMMGHEIRTPLHGVLGSLSLLSDTAMDPEQCKLVELSRRSAESLMLLINDILDFSAMEAGKLDLETTVFDPRALVESVIEVLAPQAAERGLKLAGAVDAPVPDCLEGDATKIRQVLLNLASNGVKFTQHGEVRIQVSVLQEGTTGCQLRFAVSDTGIGIAHELQPRLFEEFWTRSLGTIYGATGSGLGLAISRRLVDLLGGTIGFVSEPGAHSCFWFDLLLAQPTAGDLAREHRRRAQPAHLTPGVGVRLVGRVLLAEDNTSNQWIGKAMVAKLGLNVDVVANGREALEAVRSRPYDLVLMDIGMPEMDGIEATKAIRALPGPAARLPIIAMTAHVLHSERENILGEGLDDFLSKPVDRSELTACLVRWLGSKPGAQVGQAQPTESRAVRPEPAAAEPAAAPAPALAPAAQAEPTVPRPPALDGPMIDRAKLVQMCNEVGLDMAPEVLDSFFQELDQQGVALQQAAAAGDLSALSRAAHRLKSGATACGALPLSRIAAALEQAGKAGLVDETAAGMQELARIAPATREAMLAARREVLGQTSTGQA